MAVEDILIAPINLYLAPVGEANPSESSVEYGGAWGGNWVALGMTDEDTPLSWNPEVERHEGRAQQYLGALKRANTQEAHAFETTLIELLADAWVYAFDGANNVNTAAGSGQRAFDEIKGGGVFVPNEWKVGFEGYRVTASGVKYPVRVFGHKANLMVGGTLEFGKSNTTGIPIRFDLLEDISQAADEHFFQIQIVTAKATDE